MTTMAAQTSLPTRPDQDELDWPGIREVIAANPDLNGAATYRKLDYWDEEGYLLANPRPAGAGSGWPRTWAMPEVRIFAAMVRLTAAFGMAVPEAARIARAGATAGYVQITRPGGVSLICGPDLWSV